MQFIRELFSSPQNLIGQSFGFVAMVLALFIYAFRDRRKVLITKMSGDILWFFHYMFLGGYSGAAVNAVNTFREAVFYNRTKHKWAEKGFWPIFFVILTVVMGMMPMMLGDGVIDPISFLPILGSSLSVVGLWCKDPMMLRIISFPAILLWCIYSACLGAVFAIICNAFSLTSIAVGLIGDVKKRKSNHK